MKIEIIKISKKLKNLREKKHLTQEELAKNLGVSRQSIISLEQGKCLPSLPLAISFSEIFKMPLEEIFINEINNMREEVKHFMSRDLSPWSPYHEISSLHDAIDRIFEENISSNQVLLQPQVNIREKNKEIIIIADLPGVKEEDISIEVGTDSVTVSGQRFAEINEKEENYYRSEISYGEFSRTIPLPYLLNKDKAEAELKDGTLTITIPKIEKAKPKITKLKVKRG